MGAHAQAGRFSNASEGSSHDARREGERVYERASDLKGSNASVSLIHEAKVLDSRSPTHALLYSATYL